MVEGLLTLGRGWGAAAVSQVTAGDKSKESSDKAGRGGPHTMYLVGLARSSELSGPSAVPSVPWLLLSPIQVTALAASLTPQIWAKGVPASPSLTHDRHRARAHNTFGACRHVFIIFSMRRKKK